MAYVTGLEKMLMKKGHEEGFEKGRADYLEVLGTLLEIKYGKAGERLFNKLKTVQDDSRLRAVHQAIRDGATVAQINKLI